jgi:tetraacyldisaccharide 4'-kinase
MLELDMRRFLFSGVRNATTMSRRRMLAPTTLHDLASGKRRGWAAATFRCVTAWVEPLVRWGVRRKNRAYDQGRRQVHRVDTPVISVGNLTVGGTGKTPMVEWIARWLQARGQRVVLISRGYGSQAGAANDEARELALKLPEVPHLQNPDRVAAAQQAQVKYPGHVLLLDDAFQHRRIHRDLDLVLLDALAPFGYEHLLPRGLLREPLEGLGRAQVIVLTRANLVDQAARLHIRTRAMQLAPAAAWVEAIHAPRELANCQGDAEPAAQLQGKRIAAFCGIGNPIGFRRTLERAGAQIVAWQELPDHASYPATQLQMLERWLQPSNAEMVVCTQKDLVKIPRESLGNLPLRALVIGMEITCGEQHLAAALEASLAARNA